MSLEFKNITFIGGPIGIGNLTEMKNKLDIIGATYTPRIGEFIQFYLSPEYVMTYLPDTSLLNS